MLQREHSAILLTFIKYRLTSGLGFYFRGSILQYFRPSLSYHLSLRSSFCLFLSGCFTQVYRNLFSLSLRGSLEDCSVRNKRNEKKRENLKQRKCNSKVKTVQAPGPEAIKHFPCSTQLSKKFILLINMKMPTIVGVFTFISLINTTSERLKAIIFFICRYFSFYEQLKFLTQLS